MFQKFFFVSAKNHRMYPILIPSPPPLKKKNCSSSSKVFQNLPKTAMYGPSGPPLPSTSLLARPQGAQFRTMQLFENKFWKKLKDHVSKHKVLFTSLPHMLIIFSRGVQSLFSSCSQGEYKRTSTCRVF